MPSGSISNGLARTKADFLDEVHKQIGATNEQPTPLITTAVPPVFLPNSPLQEFPSPYSVTLPFPQSSKLNSVRSG